MGGCAATSCSGRYRSRASRLSRSASGESPVRWARRIARPTRHVTARSPGIRPPPTASQAPTRGDRDCVRSQGRDRPGPGGQYGDASPGRPGDGGHPDFGPRPSPGRQRSRRNRAGSRRQRRTVKGGPPTSSEIGGCLSGGVFEGVSPKCRPVVGSRRCTGACRTFAGVGRRSRHRPSADAEVPPSSG